MFRGTNSFMQNISTFRLNGITLPSNFIVLNLREYSIQL